MKASNFGHLVVQYIVLKYKEKVELIIGPLNITSLFQQDLLMVRHHLKKNRYKTLVHIH